MLIMVSCDGQDEIGSSGLGNFDLSHNDKSIIFSYYTNDVAQIYLSSVSGDSVKSVLRSSSDTSYVHPKFSPDGENILFLAFPKNKKSSNIFISDKYGNNKKQVTFQNQIITEAIFASRDNKIYYSKAGTYESFSPIGRAGPHEMDIFEIDIETAKERKVTSLNAYGIHAFTEVVDGKYLLARLEYSGGIGMYLIDLNKPQNIQPIIPVNNPRGSADMYSDPYYSQAFNKVAFTAPYELYIMDLESKNARLVYGPKNEDIGHINNVIIFNREEKVLFRKNGEDAIRVIDFNGANFRKVDISLN